MAKQPIVVLGNRLKYLYLIFICSLLNLLITIIMFKRITKGLWIWTKNVQYAEGITLEM